MSTSALGNAPVSNMPFMFNSPKSIGKNSMRFLHLRLMLVESCIRSSWPFLMTRMFWNSFVPEKDCGITSL